MNTMKIEKMVLDAIKNCIQDFTLDCSHKQVMDKAGFEETFWITWTKKGLQHFYAQHHYEIPEERTPEELADEIFFGPFTKGIENIHRLGELKESWWKRVKFVFFK